MARRKNPIQQRSTIPTIIGAGITEQWYFTHLQRIFGYRIKVRPRFFGQEDIYQLTKKIDSVLSDGGIAIVVFDADVASWNTSEREKLLKFRKKYAQNANVIICDSLPSIEYWFLLHFADIHRLFPTSKSVSSEVAKYLPGYNKTDIYLSHPSWVRTLCDNNRLETAITNASKCKNGQSYTNLPLAINKIKS